MAQSIIRRDPEVLGGAPVFSGTRVTIRILLEHLEAGARIDDFLYDYPSVGREQVVELIDLVIERLGTIDD